MPETLIGQLPLVVHMAKRRLVAQQLIYDIEFVNQPLLSHGPLRLLQLPAGILMNLRGLFRRVPLVALVTAIVILPE